MRLAHLIVSCCLLISTLVVSQAQATGLVSGTPGAGGVAGGVLDGSFMFSKEIEIEAKDIIVNVGKVNIEIEREQNAKQNEDSVLSGGAQDAEKEADNRMEKKDGNKISIEKEIEIEAKDIIVNIGKVNIEIEREQRKKQNEDSVLSGGAQDAEKEADNRMEKKDGNKISIEKEIEIEAKDIIVNVGKVNIEVEKSNDRHFSPPLSRLIGMIPGSGSQPNQ